MFTNSGPWVNGQVGQTCINKLAPYRWMGCTVAVYDCVLQEKAVGGGETSCARRGTKRRGKRKGRRNARKRRRLVTADPGSCSRPSLQRVVERKRRSYLQDRRSAYLQRLVGICARLFSRSTAKNRHTGRFTYPRARATFLAKRARLVALRARTTGDSLEFSKLAVATLIQISAFGFEPIRLEEGDVEEALRESGIEYRPYEEMGAKALEAIAASGSPSTRTIGWREKGSWTCPYCGRGRVTPGRPVCQVRSCGISSSRYEHLSDAEFDELCVRERERASPGIGMIQGRPTPNLRNRRRDRKRTPGGVPSSSKGSESKT